MRIVRSARSLIRRAVRRIAIRLLGLTKTPGQDKLALGRSSDGEIVVWAYGQEFVLDRGEALRFAQALVDRIAPRPQWLLVPRRLQPMTPEHN